MIYIYIDYRDIAIFMINEILIYIAWKWDLHTRITK